MKFLPAFLLLFAALSLAACSNGGGFSVVENEGDIDVDEAEQEGEVPDEHEVVTESDQQAPSGDEVDIDEGEGVMPVFEEDQIPPEVYDAYDGLVEFVIEDLEFYWGQVFPEVFGLEWEPVEIFGPYYSEGDVDCAGEAAVLNNAFYCPVGDFIAWDEPSLLLPYYLNIGDFGAALVLAHEYGHAVQARLGIVAEFTIQTELQADCFAGAWALSADEAGILEEGDLEEGFETLYSIADPDGVDWTDPNAHGSAEERIDAFALGFDSGAEACFEFTEF
ncbi:MAG: neutral zinc metallopeptidase [Dehalococcoidia bacterium]